MLCTGYAGATVADFALRRDKASGEIHPVPGVLILQDGLRAQRRAAALRALPIAPAMGLRLAPGRAPLWRATRLA